MTYYEIIQVTSDLYNYKRCSKWWAFASRHLLVQLTTLWVTVVIDITAHAFSISSVRTSSIVSFLRCMTTSKVPHTKVTPCAWKHHTIFLFLQWVYIFGRLCIFQLSGILYFLVHIIIFIWHFVVWDLFIQIHTFCSWTIFHHFCVMSLHICKHNKYIYELRLQSIFLVLQM